MEGRQHEDRDRAGLPDGLEHFQAIEDRELDIQQDQIWRFFVKEVQGLLPITCFKDLIATFHEIVAHPFANQDFIFYD